MTIAGAAVGVSAQCTRGHSLEFGPFIHLFRKKTMKSDEAGFWACLSVLRGTLRSVGWMLFLGAVVGVSGGGRSMAASLERQHRAPNGVNHTAPIVTPPTSELRFSSQPTDAEFLRAGLFVEPLAPAAATTAQENRDLAQALLSYRDAVRQSGASDAVEPILAFLAAHPTSAWKPALQLDLGIVYRQTGHFSKALATWQAGWREARGLTDSRGRVLADAMVAHLSQLEAYLGRKELLQPLLDSIEGRPVGGTAAQLITNSHTGLYEMLHDPGESFLCGPLALKRILHYAGSTPAPASLRVLDAAQSTPNGLSLSAVQAIAANAGMDYQMAFRTPGARVLIPAVAHWKVGHYAAIVDHAEGRYIVQDTTFGEDIRVSSATLDEEASGYFLVPAGPLPEGWRSVQAEEGSTVWGRGDTGNNHDSGATGAGCPTCGGGGGSGGGGSDGGGGANTSGGYTTATVEQEVVGLQLHDMPIGYTPPLGPAVTFNLYYSHRDTQQPTTFAYTNFGRKWTFTWLSYITDKVGSSSAATVYLRGGGNEPYTFSGTTATTAYAGPYSQAILTRTVNSSGASTGFTLTNRDGSFEQFNQPFGQAPNQVFFMTAVADPAGNKVTLTYDSQMRIVAITDALGQVSILSYGLSSSPLVVTQITDPFGRTASFTYTADGHLASVTDVLGITSSYKYGQGTDPDFVNTLTTPYGSTTFVYGDSSTNSSLGSTRFLKTTDPLNRTSYVEFDQGVDAGDTSGGGLKNASLLPTGMNACNEYMHWRNTFVFDANEYALASQGSSLNYSLAHVIHWLHTSDGAATSRFIESEKQPLENRVWYSYPNQTSCISSSVSSGGAVTNGASNQPSVVGRVLDNGTTQLQTYTYNSNGNVTRVVDAVGRTTTYTYAANGIDRLSTANTTNGTQVLETRTYNSQHQPLTVTGANGMTSRYQYNAAGQVTRFTDALGHVTTYTYDPSGRLRSMQGPVAGYLYSFSYDNVSRVAARTDPAGSTVRYTYDAADRETTETYPDGTSQQYTYTLLDRTGATDRLGQATTYGYDADRELIRTTDPLGHTEQRSYNPAGKVASLTDANNHTTTFVRDAQSRLVAKQFADGTSASLAYLGSTSLVALLTDALGQVTTYTYNPDNTTATVGYQSNQPTAAVSFSYDPAYSRLVSMTDGTGTTTFSYYPVTSGPALGANQLRSVSSPIAGSSGSDTVTYTYDALNRTVGMNVNGAAQSVGYDAVNRITSASNPLDTFVYGYSDATRRLASLTSSLGPNLALAYYGPQGDELLQQLGATTQSGTSLLQFTYNYDSDHNITAFTESSPAATTAYTYDAANRLKSGTVGSASTPQYAYNYDAASNLTSITTNGTTQGLAYSATNTITSGTYDANGSPTSLGGNAYVWDGANRIVGFTGTANNTSNFVYDGLGRLVRVIDRVNGTITSDKSYFWCGSLRCLAHDNTQSGSPVSTQYFNQGAIVNGTSYYYVKDRLGSVRELVTTGGSVAVQYEYDPYGNPTTLSGTAVSDLGYAGYFHHAASGLDFAVHRAYDSTRGRWLNRDPIGESGGINLYAYVDSNPIASHDLNGTCKDPDCEKADEDCFEKCQHLLGKGGRSNQGYPYRNCWKNCMKEAGCRDEPIDPLPEYDMSPAPIPAPPPTLPLAVIIIIFLIPWPGNPVYLGL